jgi:hypothetical protein
LELYRCPACGELFDAGVFAQCPACGTAARAAGAQDLVIDVRAEADDGETIVPAQAPAHVPGATSGRPFADAREFSGRLWPGGPAFQGRTFVFRSGGQVPDTRGCCGCGCLLMLLFGFVFVKGLLALFQ